jgi:hypothetical protein
MRIALQFGSSMALRCPCVDWFVPDLWHFWEMEETLGAGATEGKLGPSGLSFKGMLRLWPLSLPLLCCCHRWACVLHHMINCTTTGPKQRDQATIGWHLWNHESETPFLLSVDLCQVCTYTDGKLSRKTYLHSALLSSCMCRWFFSNVEIHF